MGDYSRGVIIEVYANVGADAVGMATALLTNSGDVTTMEKASGGLVVGRAVLRGDVPTRRLTVNNNGEIVTSGCLGRIDLRAAALTMAACRDRRSTITLTNGGAIRPAAPVRTGYSCARRVYAFDRPETSGNIEPERQQFGRNSNVGDQARD